MKSLIVANWKMNTSLADANVLATMIVNGLRDVDNVTVVVCPPFVWLSEVADILAKSSPQIFVGAQNCFYKENGAFTGEISAKMLESLCQYIIVGHSERRKYFSETDSMISQKVEAVLAADITPILCVGEPIKKSDSIDLVVEQLKASLTGIRPADYSRIIVAYEPVWAISTETTGEIATGEYASLVCAAIKKAVGKNVRVIYGGSVSEANVADFLSRPNIDGVLVGAASLKAKGFIALCKKVKDNNA